MRITDSLISSYMAGRLLATYSVRSVDTSVAPERSNFFDDSFWYAGAGGTELAAWVMDPKRWQVGIVEGKPDRPTNRPDWHCYHAPSGTARSKPWVVMEADSSEGSRLDCRGTLLLIHGWRDSVLERPYLRGLAALLAGEGYRVVMPDLRGHGLSRGRHLSYGLRERLDMAALLDELEARYPDGRRFGIIGHSIGGNIAMMTAAADTRIRAAVVASAPDHFRGILPGSVKRYNPHLAWMVSGRAIDLSMQKAGKITGVNLFESNAMEAIASVDIPVLLIHGGKDVTIMPSCVQRIYDSRPENTELLYFPEGTHAGLFGSELDEIHRRCVALFDRSIKNAPD